MKKSLLKFITCGSVDDGKSTLIGHMLYDAKLIFTDQEKALELDSRIGSCDGKIDYSLLLDGLMAEREQGITIDVAYRYFTTEKRSFIVADTPGHEEYTRNMAVGASFADLAVILVDATQGMLIQTRRHIRICSLMGINHFVFAVNKMDMVHYEKDVFDRIARDIKRFVSEFPVESLQIIPVSATQGDNITMFSDKMPWYRKNGYSKVTLLSWLEEVEVFKDNAQQGFLMPIQRVSRPDHTFRGFQGEIASGVLHTGEEIEILPSGVSVKVKDIYVTNKRTDTAVCGQAVTICLHREVDASRGCVFSRNDQAEVSNLFTTKILWMDDKELIAGRNYWIKLGTRVLPATVMDIRYKIDVNTGEQVRVDKLYKNELAECDISVAEKTALMPFKKNRTLGAFILIDRLSNMTSACGTVIHTVKRLDNLTWQESDITREIRAEMKAQKPITIWFTGLSGSGKSTLANALEKRLVAMGKHTMLLDGDNIRMGLNCNLGFGEADRVENIRRIAEVAKLMNDAGLIVMTAFISPYKKDRERAKAIIGEENFVEVYVNTPLEECERRDIKGLYRKARTGEIADFTGVTSPYEEPDNPKVIVNTKCETVEKALAKILGIM